MRVYDVRIGLRGRPQMVFGYSDQSTSKLLTSDLRRGATSEFHFVRGYQDGLICLWDYRKSNVSCPSSRQLLSFRTLKNSIAQQHPRFASRTSRISYDIWRFWISNLVILRKYRGVSRCFFLISSPFYSTLSLSHCFALAFDIHCPMLPPLKG